MSIKIGTSFLALTVAISAANLSYAQEDTSAGKASFELQEILVTARKTEERLQDVPLAITAITGELIEATGANGLEDIARMTPGFAFERTVGSLGQPVIRGQAQSRVTNPVQNVATFFNGVYLQRSYQVDSDLLALERVEVIKGPQATMFGRNAFAGASNFVTKKPDLDTVEGTLEATYGNHDKEELKGYISIPIGGIAGVSLAASTSEFDGTWKNENYASEALSNLPTKGNLGGYDNESFLAQFLVKPVDSLTLNGFWSRREIFIENAASYGQSSMSAIRAGNTGNCYPFEDGALAGNPYLNGAYGLYCGSLSAEPLIAEGENRPAGILADRRGFGQDGTSEVFGLSMAYEVTEGITLSYDYGKTESDSINMATLSGDPVNGTFFGGTLFDSRGNGDIESDSHDLRIEFQGDGLRLMGGVFMSDVADYDWGVTFLFPPNTDTPINLNSWPVGHVFPPGFSASNRDEDIKALYGLAAYDITERLTVTAEARYTEESIEQQAVDYYSGEGIGTKFKEDFEYTTPRFTVNYALTDEMMLYTSVAKGVKSGGFNTRAVLAEELIYDPEVNWTYELGAKGSLFDNRVTYDAALYYTDWEDLQASQAQTNAVLGTPLIIGNVAGAEVKGLEVSALYFLTEEITVNLGGSISDATYDNGTIDPVISRALCQYPALLPAGSPECPYTGDVGGNQIARAPKTQANIGVAYEKEMGDVLGMAVSFFARADYSYQSKQYTDPTNTAFVPSRNIVDGSFGFRSDSWKLRFWGKNLFDEKYASYAFATFAPLGQGSGVSYSPLLGDRRTYGATITYTY